MGRWDETATAHAAVLLPLQHLRQGEEVWTDTIRPYRGLGMIFNQLCNDRLVDVIHDGDEVGARDIYPPLVYRFIDAHRVVCQESGELKYGGKDPATAAGTDCCDAVIA